MTESSGRTSYYRQCQFCDRRIQMRLMPNGRWLPFDGFEIRHDCRSNRPSGSPISDSIHTREPSPVRSTGLFDDIDFAQVQVPEHRSPSAQSQTSSTVRPPASPARAVRKRSEVLSSQSRRDTPITITTAKPGTNKSSSSERKWGIWFIVLVILVIVAVWIL